MSATETFLSDILQREVSGLSPETPLRDIPGFDSIMMVRLMLKLEETLDRELTDRELEGIETMADVRLLAGLP